MQKMPDEITYHSDHFINRELSWLEFNHRVLEEARDKRNPIFEQMKFLAIASSNLDEFFMVRVASLKEQVNAGYDKADPSGLTPKRQLKQISIRVHEMINHQYNTYNKSLLPRLKKRGFRILKEKQLSRQQRKYVEDYFRQQIYPVLTPMAVDFSRPFPLILNRSLNIALLVKEKGEETPTFATVQVPAMLPRLVPLPSEAPEGVEYMLLEEVMMLFLQELFTSHRILCAHPYRITRNADLSIEEEEAKDLLMEIEKSVKRRRWGAAIRLEADARMDPQLLDILQESLEIHRGEIYLVNGPLDLTFLMKACGTPGFDHLKYPNFEPVMPPIFREEASIFQIIAEKDRFLHVPYDSFEPVIRFVQQAAEDPQVLAIKQTLYRVSGDSPIIKALAEAADRGKQVTVLVEVMARFDEENNIQWAKQLEKAGCHVIYGLVGLKTHSKITLVVRREEDRIKRYLHLGTGNYNDSTARLYTDMGIFTCREQYAAEASSFFNMLTGYSEPPDLFKLTVAPLNMRETFNRLIHQEAENARQGKKAMIRAQMNSLVDQQIIEALYDASRAGVTIQLLVRGICSLRPGLPGISENITVHSIVGRFLEHPRIFYFEQDGRRPVYLSSADWMSRNLDRRIELLFEVEEPDIKAQILEVMRILFNDTLKTRLLQPDGSYLRVDKRGKERLEAQLYFCERARVLEKEHRRQQEAAITFEPILSSEALKKETP
ncbi:RNA degradosome polyphosphate kinase [Anoxynatronum buryatiense]|uniref:Polyphosphate kinase n=1 Tax=Anoxynatronum buryatiense TaxID=489973 RepID=A0AA46AIY2_9CLOT|nr:RNA degradosome polyphosphate kinase [Anoxynatronum buryatiense]SMP56074.1 polyphosphate kinase [Anoxynatronum buryatiense]